MAFNNGPRLVTTGLNLLVDAGGGRGKSGKILRPISQGKTKQDK